MKKQEILVITQLLGEKVMELCETPPIDHHDRIARDYLIKAAGCMLSACYALRLLSPEPDETVNIYGNAFPEHKPKPPRKPPNKLATPRSLKINSRGSVKRALL